MFNKTNVGDKVWDIRRGWGKIIDYVRDTNYPVYVKFDIGGSEYYTMDGRCESTDLAPTLFWDEVKFEIPKKPITLKEVRVPVFAIDKGQGEFEISTGCTAIHPHIYTGELRLNIPENMGIDIYITFR